MVKKTVKRKAKKTAQKRTPGKSRRGRRRPSGLAVLLAFARGFGRRNATLLRVLGFAGALFLGWVIAEQGLIRNGRPAQGAWVYALALVILFFSRRRDVATPTRRHADTRKRQGRKRERKLWPRLGLAVVIMLVVALAVFMRIHRSDEFPPGCFSDEGWNGLEAVSIMEGKEYPLYIERNTQNPAFFFYTLALWFKMFGVSIESVRMVSVVSGVLTVLAAYFLLAAMFGRTTGVLGAVLLAGMRWHVNFSRVGFLGIQAVLLSVLAAVFFIRAVKGRRLVDFILCGVFLGLNLYHYIASYLFLVVIALGLLHLLVFQRDFCRDNWRKLCVLALAFVIVALPITLHYFNNPGHFMSRASSTTVMREVQESGSIQPLLTSVKKHLLMFNLHGDGNGRHNLPGQPMLNSLMSALAILGLGLAFFRLRRLEYFFPVAWLGVTLQAGILSLAWEAPQAYRTIGNTVGVVLLCALFFREFLAVFVPPGYQPRTGKDQPRSRGYYYSLVGVLALISLVSVRLDYGVYFNRQAKNAASWREFHTMEAEVGKRLSHLKGKEKVFVAPPFYRHPSILFLARDFQQHNRFDISNLSNVLPRQKCAAGAIFILEDVHEELKGMFDYFYDDYDFERVNDPWGRTMFTVYSVSGEELARARGLRLRGWRGSDGSQKPVLDELVKRSSIRVSQLPAGVTRVRLTGSFYLSRPGTVGFKLAGGEGSLLIDGKDLGGTSGGEKSISLYQGFHSLRLDAVLTSRGALNLHWRQPGRSGWSLMDESHLCRQEGVHGLRAEYYRNVKWSGAPALKQIDPTILFRWHIDPLPERFSCRWRGKLVAPESGEYLLRTRSNDHCWLKIDGRQVLKFDEGVEGTVTRTVRLAKGNHDIELKYIEYGGLSLMELWWQRPGKHELEIVPMRYLVPR